MEPFKAQCTSRCDNCVRPVGTRARLGAEDSLTARVAFCPFCDIAPTSDRRDLPPGARLALAQTGGPA